MRMPLTSLLIEVLKFFFLCALCVLPDRRSLWQRLVVVKPNFFLVKRLPLAPGAGGATV
jgi:hypothetical protein